MFEIDNKYEGHGVEVDKYIVFNRNMLHTSISLMWLNVKNPLKIIQISFRQISTSKLWGGYVLMVHKVCKFTKAGV